MELNYYENNGDNSVINDYIMDAVFMLIEKEDNLNHSEGRFVCLIILAYIFLSQQTLHTRSLYILSQLLCKFF